MGDDEPDGLANAGSTRPWSRRSWSTLLTLVMVTPFLAGAAGSVPRAAAAPPATAGVRYTAPVAGPLVVVRGFDRLDSPYAAGHRGIDLQVTSRGVVLAAGDGVVTFAGQVAGIGAVTVMHADGIRTSYEPVQAAVTSGATVRAGDVIGVVTGSHGSFPPDTVLHWGARQGERYLDPLTLLRSLGPVRLLPWTDP